MQVRSKTRESTWDSLPGPKWAQDGESGPRSPAVRVPCEAGLRPMNQNSHTRGCVCGSQRRLPRRLSRYFWEGLRHLRNQEPSDSAWTCLVLPPLLRSCRRANQGSKSSNTAFPSQLLWLTGPKIWIMTPKLFMKPPKIVLSLCNVASFYCLWSNCHNISLLEITIFLFF